MSIQDNYIRPNFKPTNCILREIEKADQCSILIGLFLRYWKYLLLSPPLETQRGIGHYFTNTICFVLTLLLAVSL